jgi:hypothetical protein
VNRAFDVEMLVDDPPDRRPVGDVVLLEDAADGELAASLVQVVDQDGDVAVRLEGGRDSTADIAGSAGDENLHAESLEEPLALRGSIASVPAG